MSDLTRAAEILEQYAEELREFHTDTNGVWLDDDDVHRVRRDHDECLALANRLRKALV